MAIRYNIENQEINSSFALLRTNPKLSSNVKLIVDSSGDIFLSAFKANKSLSKIAYQRYELKSDGFYPNDIARFYQGIEINERFEILRKESDLAPYSNYEFQYEDQYNYGAAFNATKLYDEQYKFFAPIWLDRRIPKKFVIYRVEDTDFETGYEDNVQGQNERVLELLSKATIIKTFDLTQDSKIGKYLDRFVFDKSLPLSPIQTSFGEEGETIFRGIDIKKGGFAQKNETIFQQYVNTDSIEIESNEFLTNGFERNSLVSANLVNLEFLFDDQSAEDYKIYRYFGIYVDDIPEAEFDILTSSDKHALIDKESFVSFYDVEETSLEHLDMLVTTEELALPTLNYLLAGKNEYVHIKNLSEVKDYSLPISAFKDIPKAESFKPYREKIQSSSKKVSHKGYLKLNIIDVPNENDRIFVGDKTEMKINNYNLFDFTMLAKPFVPAGRTFANTTYFSNQGSLRQIAMSLGSLIREMTTYNVIVQDNSIIIEDYAEGDVRRRMGIGVFKQNLVDFIEVEVAAEDLVKEIDNAGTLEYYYNGSLIDSTNSLVSDWNTFTSLGGSKKGAAFLVESKELGSLEVGQFVKDRKLDKFVEIKAITKDYLGDNLYRVILKKPVDLPPDGLIQLYTRFRPEIGKFNVYPLKDFNFDFHDESNSELFELKYDEQSDDVHFITLSPVLQVEDPNDLEVTADINSEYDRLHENSLKETAIQSRVVPYITKFALKNGTNARNLPYVLNVNEAFGPDNISPNILLESGRSAENLNMEHFHFNQMDFAAGSNDETGLRSYVDFVNDGGLTIDKLKSTQIDYFDLYLNWNGYVHRPDNPDESPRWVHDSPNRMYTVFNDGNGELESSAVFRGLRYLYKKRKETEKIEPTEFIQTSEVNDYKFASVVSYVTGEDITNNTVSYEVIKNDVFKFICVYITISVVNNDIEFLNRTKAYSLEDILLNGEITETKLSAGLDIPSVNFGNPGEPYGEFQVQTTAFNLLQQTSNYTEEITRDSEGNYGWVYFISSVTNSPYALKVIKVIDDATIIVANRPAGFNLSTGTDDGTFMSDAQIAAENWPNKEFLYWGSGSAGWKNLFEEIVSYNYSQRFNRFGEIQYTTVTKEEELINQFVLEVEDGIDIVKPSYLEAIADGDRPKSYQLGSAEIGKIITKRSEGAYYTKLRRMNGNYSPIFREVVPFTDIYTENKMFVPVFGETEIQLPYPTFQEIADANPDVVVEDFDTQEEWEEAIEAIRLPFLKELERPQMIYNKFKGSNIAFSSYKGTEPNYGFIENMYYHKVNEEDVKALLKLSETTDKLPLYPMIGEIAIDKKNVNVFKSKYAADYFTKSLAGGASETAHGTLTPVEIKSFMASTVMKVKDVYYITRFNQTQETGIDALDAIRRDGLDLTAIHWIENDSQIIADFYLPRSIYNEILEDGILERYKNYVEPENSFGDKETIKDDLQKYVYSNIVNRFIIDNIEVYGIEGKDINTDFISVDHYHELGQDDFKVQTGFDIQSYQNDALNFRLIYNKRVGYNYNLKVGIKIQA